MNIREILMDRGLKRTVRNILNFLLHNPNSKNNLEGIARYWIFQQRVEEELEAVQMAIEYLVDRDFVEEVQKEGNDKFYRLNQDNIPKIYTLLSSKEFKEH